MPNLNFRFTPNYVKVKELTGSGVIGGPVAASFREFIPARHQAAQWPAGSWAWDKKRSGGLPDCSSAWFVQRHYSDHSRLDIGTPGSKDNRSLGSQTDVAALRLRETAYF